MSFFKDFNYTCRSASFRKLYKFFTLSQFIEYHNETIVNRLYIINQPNCLETTKDLYNVSQLLLSKGLIEISEDTVYKAHDINFYIIREKDSSVTSSSKESNSIDKLIEITTKYLNLLKSARDRNKEFNLSLNDVSRLLERKTCFYSKRSFIDNHPKYCRTIDRKDHSKGYIKGNVVACTAQMNQLKNLLFESPSNETYRIDIKDLTNFAERMKR